MTYKDNDKILRKFIKFLTDEGDKTKETLDNDRLWKLLNTADILNEFLVGLKDDIKQEIQQDRQDSEDKVNWDKSELD